MIDACPPQINFFAYYIWGPLGSISSLTMGPWAPAGIFAGGGGASPKKAPPQKKIEIVLSPFLGARRHAPPRKF